MKVVVLAGGKGTRLGLTDRPKPMVPVDGRPLLQRIVESAKATGFSDFVLLNGFGSDVIEEYFGDGSRFGVQITHVREEQPLGTAGAFHDVRGLLREPFIVLYGDILIDVDLAHFAAFALRTDALGCLFVHPNDHPYDSDLVEADVAGRIVAFHSKPHAAGTLRANLVSGALYVLRPEVIDFIPSGRPSDWGKDVFPALLSAGRVLLAYRSLEYAKDIGTPNRLAAAESDLRSGRVARMSRRSAKPAVFFDRDGVLNREIDGVHRPEDLALLEGAGEAVRAVNRAGIPSICVTNQPGLAKGHLTVAALSQVFAALDTGLAAHGAYLDDVYYCPHHPERGWPGEVAELKIDCDCRKPLPGLLLKAARIHNLDLGRSWMIGDRPSDVVAAHAAGARAVLLNSRFGASAGASAHPPERVADDIKHAVSLVLENLA